jgi:hypothetical protein
MAQIRPKLGVAANSAVPFWNCNFALLEKLRKQLERFPKFHCVFDTAERKEAYLQAIALFQG